MSNNNSILAIGVAAIFLLCAVSAAIIVASDNNDNTANDTSSNTRIRSYSSYSTDSVAEKSVDTQMSKYRAAYAVETQKAAEDEAAQEAEGILGEFTYVGNENVKMELSKVTNTEKDVSGEK